MLGVSWIGTLSAISNPAYEWALFRHLCLKLGKAVFVLKSKKRIGSPKYLTLSGDVLLYSINMLAMSDDMCLPISAPIPVKTPPSAKPIAESADAPAIAPPATPAPIMSSLTICLPKSPNGEPKLPLTVGLPNVLD